MKDFPILNDEIIILRKLELTDSDNYVEYVTNEKIAKQFNFSYTEETAKKRVEELVERYNQETKPFVWVIALKDTNEMVGIISVDTISYSTIILNSIKYNDNLISNLIENGQYSTNEIEYEIDKPDDSESKFSQYLQEYVVETDEEVTDILPEN